MKTKTFEFNGKTIDFEINDQNVMVNATQMAAVFGKNVKDFMKNETTKAFVNECLKRENSPFLKVFSQSDLYYSQQQKGTFMHRVLALKFAAWLNPAFELWVYATIDDILFGSYKEDENDLREIARLKTEIHRKTQALEQSPLQLELEQLNRDLKKREKKMKIRKQQRINGYLPLFNETVFRKEQC